MVMLSKFHKIFDSFTALERQVFQGAAIVFAFSVVINGINAFYQATEPAPVRGGAYAEGIVGQPITINPLIAGLNEVDRDLIEVTFSNLIELAESHKVSDDHRVWTIILKENLFWSDGEPLTTDDVVFTLETIQDPDSHSPAFATWHGVAAERLSEREVRFTLKTPYAFFLDNLETFKVVPRHIFGAIPPANLRLSDYNLEPVGNGPYKFRSYEKRRDGFITEYRFTANEHFSGDEPFITELTFRFFETYDEAIDVLNRREIDALGGVSAAHLSKIKVGHQIIELDIPRYYAIFLNQSTSLELRDRSVRMALDAAVDRDRLVEIALEDRGESVGGALFPGIEGYDPEIGAGGRFSLEAAAELLEEAGWKIGEDGTRAKRVSGSDLRLSFDLVVPDIDFLKRAAEMISEDWAKIGITVNRLTLSPAEVADEVIKTRNYQMLLFGNVLKMNPDIFSFWHSSEKFRPGLNLALYENRSVDVLLESIRKDFDPDSRAEDAAEVQELIKRDVPAVFLFSPHYLYVAPKDLGGLTSILIGSGADRFDNIASWYLKTTRIFK